MSARWTSLFVGVLVAAAACSSATASSSSLEVRGGELRDGRGRLVLLRGVNLPWGLRVPTVVDEPPQPIRPDAVQIKRLGYNVARLQLSWKAIEPGTAEPNDPRICAPGEPADPEQWDEAHAQAYLDRVEHVVDGLHRKGISTLFQVAQYGYNDRFGGPPSSPDWAVCTNGVPITAGTGAGAYVQPGVAVAADHFWRNDVRGDLQGEYARMLSALASRFAEHPGVVGYELYNEPFHPDAVTADPDFDALVQCFYAGKDDPGLLADGTRPMCPPGVPETGAIQTIRDADPESVIHPQAHIFTNFGVETHMGPLPAGNLVFNFHVYCLSEVLSQPERIREPGCDAAEEGAVAQAASTRTAMASARQPGRLGWFLSEFGYTDNEDTLIHMTELADRNYLGWAYFLWRADRGFRTGDNPGMLRMPEGALRGYASILARPYPRALAGRPKAMSYDHRDRDFELTYRPRGQARTVIVLPRFAYAGEPCVRASGASWSRRRDKLRLRARPDRSRVHVRVQPGPCGEGPPRP